MALEVSLQNRSTKESTEQLGLLEYGTVGVCTRRNSIFIRLECGAIEIPFSGRVCVAWSDDDVSFDGIDVVPIASATAKLELLGV